MSKIENEILEGLDPILKEFITHVYITLASNSTIIHVLSNDKESIDPLLLKRLDQSPMIQKCFNDPEQSKNLLTATENQSRIISKLLFDCPLMFQLLKKITPDMKVSDLNAKNQQSFEA